MINEPFNRHSLQTVLKYLLNYLSTFEYPASSIYDRELFMQNKANFQNGEVDVSSVETMNYEQITMDNDNKNKAKQTQIIYIRFSRYQSIAFCRPIEEHRGLSVNRTFKSFTPRLYFSIEYLNISVKIPA